MRATIKSVFPDRDVATLVRPALTEAELQRLDTLPAGALRPEFKKVRRGVCVCVCCTARLAVDFCFALWWMEWIMHMYMGWAGLMHCLPLPLCVAGHGLPHAAVAGQDTPAGCGWCARQRCCTGRPCRCVRVCGQPGCVWRHMPALMMAPAASVSVCLALLPPTTATEPCMRVSVKAHHSQAVGQSLSWLLS